MCEDPPPLEGPECPPPPPLEDPPPLRYTLQHEEVMDDGAQGDVYATLEAMSASEGEEARVGRSGGTQPLGRNQWDTTRTNTREATEGNPNGRDTKTHKERGQHGSQGET